MSKYIPAYEWAKSNNVQKQKIYRWIREGKIKKPDYIIDKVVVKRIRIKSDFQPLINTPAVVK